MAIARFHNLIIGGSLKIDQVISKDLHNVPRTSAVADALEGKLGVHDTADAAVKDTENQKISQTYIKAISSNEVTKKMVVTKGDNTEEEIEIGLGTGAQEVTRAEYEALSEEEKDSDQMFIITDQDIPGLIVDENLDESSTNSVQNKAIVQKFNEVETEIDDKLDKKLDDDNAAIKSAKGFGLNIKDSVNGKMIVNKFRKNLLQLDPKTETINGITFKINDDGSITVSGTATDYVNFMLRESGYDESKKYIFCYSNDYDDDVRLVYMRNGSSVTITTFYSIFPNEIESEVCKFRLWVKSGATVNKTFYPMIELYDEDYDLDTYPHLFVPKSYILKSCKENLFDGVYVKDRAMGMIDVDKFRLIAENGSRCAIIECAPNTEYYVEKSESNRFGVYAADSIEFEKAYTRICNDNPGTFTTPSYARYLIVYVSNINGEEPNLIVGRGSEIKPYEEYKGDSVTITDETKAPLVLNCYDGVTNLSHNAKVIYPANEAAKVELQTIAQIIGGGYS